MSALAINHDRPGKLEGGRRDGCFGRILTRLAGTEAHHAYWVACMQAGETSPWRLGRMKGVEGG